MVFQRKFKYTQAIACLKSLFQYRSPALFDPVDWRYPHHPHGSPTSLRCLYALRSGLRYHSQFLWWNRTAYYSCWACYFFKPDPDAHCCFKVQHWRWTYRNWIRYWVCYMGVDRLPHHLSPASFAADRKSFDFSSHWHERQICCSISLSSYRSWWPQSSCYLQIQKIGFGSSGSTLHGLVGRIHRW